MQGSTAAPVGKAALVELGQRAAARAAERAAADADAAPDADAPATATRRRSARRRTRTGADDGPRILPGLRVTIPADILGDPYVRPADVTVFVALASYAGRAGRDGRRVAWPSVRAIAARAPGIEHRQAQRIMARLIRFGYVYRIHRGSTGRSNWYSFL